MKQVLIEMLFLAYNIAAVFILGFAILLPFVFDEFPAWVIACTYIAAFIIATTQRTVMDWLTKKL